MLKMKEQFEKVTIKMKRNFLFQQTDQYKIIEQFLRYLKIIKPNTIR